MSPVDEECTSAKKPRVPSSDAIGLPDISDLKGSVKDAVKYDLISNLPLVEANYAFPTTNVPEKKNSSGFSLRKCSYALFEKYPFLGYSKVQDGVYCVPCKLWYTTPQHGTEASYLIVEPFRDWKKVHSKMRSHSSTAYHKDSVHKMDLFKKIQQGNPEQRSAVEAQSSAHALLVQKNREIIGSVFMCLKLCIQQGFARRGHRDSGPVPLKESADSFSEDVINIGNFKAILAFCAASGNHVLKDHLKNAAKNASYVSSVAQLDLLNTYLKLIQQEIVKEAKDQEGKFVFAISVDEVTDISTTEQLGIVIRTVSTNGAVKERLLEFIGMESITGYQISKAVVECLERHGLSLADCRAQTYDGAANMSGVHNGCKAHIQNIQPLAEYHHCSSHRLNLALNDTAKVSEFRVMMENIKALGIFFKYSPKRQNVLKKLLPSEVTVKKVKLLCETRWVERHSTMAEIKMLYPYIISALSEMTGSSYSTNTVREASGLFYYLQSPGFIASFVVAEHMLGYTAKLSRQLQGSAKNVHSAHNNISDVLDVIKSVRSNPNSFDALWEDMGVMNGKKDLDKPRLCSQQSHRSNPCVDSPKAYYRAAFFCPYVDHLIQDLGRRFESKSTITEGFNLIPAILKNLVYPDFKDQVDSFAQKHKKDLPDYATFAQELHTWFLKWHDSPSACDLDDLEKAYSAASESGLYPNVLYLLKLMLTIPVTSASVERANSTLKFIKNPLRSTMSQNSLNAMVLGYKHKDLLEKITIDELVTNFALTKKRRMHLHNPLSE